MLTLILIKNMENKKIWKGPNLKFDYAHRYSSEIVKNMTNDEYVGLAMIYRTAKKICRKCYCKLPPNSKICRNKKCRNKDLRYKHEYIINSFHCPIIKVSINFKTKKLKNR